MGTVNSVEVDTIDSYLTNPEQYIRAAKSIPSLGSIEISRLIMYRRFPVSYGGYLALRHITNPIVMLVVMYYQHSSGKQLSKDVMRDFIDFNLNTNTEIMAIFKLLSGYNEDDAYYMENITGNSFHIIDAMCLSITYGQQGRRYYIEDLIKKYDKKPENPNIMHELNELMRNPYIEYRINQCDRQAS